MRARQLITIAVAALLLIGGAAALGAASPVDQANDTGADAYGENHPDDERGAGDASEDRADTADGIGPSDGLPDQVPDHVTEVHETIESFLSGSINTLGESLGGLLGDGEAADENAGSANDGDADA